jgi:Zn-dependent protease
VRYDSHMTIVLIITGLLFSIIFHELAHGLAALCMGDTTAKRMGRLTLNPISHIDVIGSIVLPLILFITHSPVLFGWAKPVPYNPALFKNERLGTCFVAMAGPLTNFILAIILSVPLHTMSVSRPIGGVLILLITFNLILGFFNLVPIPPLDGSKVLGAMLPSNIQVRYFAFEKWGMLLLIGLLYVGLLSKVIVPVIKMSLSLLLPS